jgi:hypothetical protein
MTLFERVHMPSFAGATEWLNSEPLGSAELRGHVVLANFWTLTCINWLRQEPYVRAWSPTETTTLGWLVRLIVVAFPVSARRTSSGRAARGA